MNAMEPKRQGEGQRGLRQAKAIEDKLYHQKEGAKGIMEVDGS